MTKIIVDRCVNNQLAGLELKDNKDGTYPLYDLDNGPAIKDSIFMAYDDSGAILSMRCTHTFSCPVK